MQNNPRETKNITHQATRIKTCPKPKYENLDMKPDRSKRRSDKEITLRFFEGNASRQITTTPINNADLELIEKVSALIIANRMVAEEKPVEQKKNEKIEPNKCSINDSIFSKCTIS